MIISLNEELGPAVFKAGEGEQHWGGKKRRVHKYMGEEDKKQDKEQDKKYTPEKRLGFIKDYNELTKKYKVNIEKYINTFKKSNLEDFIIHPEAAEKFTSMGQAMEKECDEAISILSNIKEQCTEDGDEANAATASVLEDEYTKFSEVAYKLYSAMEAIIVIMAKVNRKN